MPDLVTEIRRAFMAGIGAFSLTTDRVQSLVDELMARGEIGEKDARAYINELLENAQMERAALQNSIREEVELVVKSMGVVTHKDFEKLEEKIGRIERLMEKHVKAKKGKAE